MVSGKAGKNTNADGGMGIGQAQVRPPVTQMETAEYVFALLRSLIELTRGRAGMALVVGGFLLNGYGMLLRTLISGRPPVTNMYEVPSTMAMKSVMAGLYTAPPAQGPRMALIWGTTPDARVLRRKISAYPPRDSTPS